LEDAEVITSHRHRMFVDSGFEDPLDLQTKTAAFLEWLRPRLSSGYYHGWLVEHRSETVAGPGTVTLDWPAHPRHLEPARAYVLNVYVSPDFRGRGLARRLTQRALEEANRRGLGTVVLHASELGKPLYEKIGFVRTNEMWFP
jgi:ribosomal protein S18 acetylase RimI-like enzyme